MKQFMDKNFLLSSDTAQKLYFDNAADTPILDYHCHINPQEIYEDRQFENITQVWLGGDHYKWRFMRSCGVEERFITGDAPDKEKFLKWAECVGKAIGNPLFHWSHLELQKYFGYHGVLNKKTAEEVWDLCNKKLADPSMSARNLIRQSNVTLVCTTDDPVDTLEWHKKIAEDDSFDVQVLPAWRPDKAMNIEKPTFVEYLSALSEASGTAIKTFADLKQALSNRMDFFASMGCSISDHGLEYVMYHPASDEEVEAVFAKRLLGSAVTREEELCYKTAFMVFVGREYAKRGWVMQLHYGCKRDNNTLRFDKLGPDTGFDCINNYAPSSEIADYLNALVKTDELPKTIIYSLNPNDNQAIGTILGCFQDSTAVAKIQQGSAWWFNDHKTGMQDQMISLA
ncbi:MAG: glucuronate isomerase, partial [Eubacterium sp.]|nr:glucuronate isomerase [Eubacterium sp.]